MTEIESHAHPVSFSNQQAPILAVEIEHAESPMIQIVVWKQQFPNSAELVKKTIEH